MVDRREWTTPAQLRAHTEKLWQQGKLLAALCDADPVFPLRLPLKGPDSRALSDDFAAVRTWSAVLLGGEAGQGGDGYRLVLREVRHRVIGANRLPAEAWLDTPDDAFALIRRQREAQRFRTTLAFVRERAPMLLPWLARRPLKALELADQWPRLIDVVAWLQAHPRPECFLRQVDLPGIDTKFIEQHQGVLSELFDLVLPPDAIEPDARGQAGFAQRYGFRDKPARVRLRALDPGVAPLSSLVDHDLTLTATDFARLRLALKRVFITENEINFLAFPPHPKSIVILGGGYGFAALSGAMWLHDCELYYWGDIDTHGFAILSQLRGRFPHTRSLLMDHDTLFRHLSQWVNEPAPARFDVLHLDHDEADLLEALRANRFGLGIRLEQERIAFGHLTAVLSALPALR